MCRAGRQATKMLFSTVQSRPPPDKGGPSHLVEEVAMDLRTTEHVVEIDTHAASTLEFDDVMEVVVADDVTPHGPVAARIDGPGIIGFQAHMVD